MTVQSCVSPSGTFVYGIHKPCYRVDNLRSRDFTAALGTFPDGRPLANTANFPAGDLEVLNGRWIYEIPNALPFLGTAYIDRGWAEATARDEARFALPPLSAVSLTGMLREWRGETPEGPDPQIRDFFGRLPEPMLLALAGTSTDPRDLELLARMSCPFECDPETGRPVGLRYAESREGRPRPVIERPGLFETLVNNPHLPDDFKLVMVLRPGAQGTSEIVGEYGAACGPTHVFEYLRRNSYIPWGHYAANMADDAIRYRISELSPADMTGLRHLYYQRTYVRLARDLGLPVPASRRGLTPAEMEELRRAVAAGIATPRGRAALTFNATLWGWNFGFDSAPTGYRLHASHQQIHQQYAMIPRTMELFESGEIERAAGQAAAYSYGDRVAAFAADFRKRTGRPFFGCYLEAIRTNRRLDGRTDREASLVVWEDAHALLLVPKAQTSQWELQVMAKGPVGNVLEADASVRASLDLAILQALKTLTVMGARMVTGVEMAKRFDADDTDQRLLYCFLPRLPESPGAFSETQRRFILGHFPEDFAAACRRRLAQLPEPESA